MEKHEPEKRKKYAPESNPQKKTKNAMDVYISDRCKIQKCTRRNFREKRVAQFCG